MLAVGDTARQIGIAVDEGTYFDQRGEAVHVGEATLDSGYLVISTAADDPDLRPTCGRRRSCGPATPSSTGDELYRC